MPMMLMLGCSSASEPGLPQRVKILKVLPHLLDKDGQHTLSPSIYERDAYQDFLKDHPEMQFGLRFDVLWRAPHSGGVTLKVEMRGIQDKKTTLTLLESERMAHSGGREWTSLELSGESFQSFGQLQAWRASLWSGDLFLAEQRSFLW